MQRDSLWISLVTLRPFCTARCTKVCLGLQKYADLRVSDLLYKYSPGQQFCDLFYKYSPDQQFSDLFYKYSPDLQVSDLYKCFNDLFYKCSPDLHVSFLIYKV